MKHSKKKMRISKRAILLLDGLLVAALIVCVIVLVSTMNKRTQAQSVQSAQGVAPAEGAQDASEPQTGQVGGQNQNVSERSATFAALAAKNVPVVAWLSGEGTALDYPVVQGADNEYYMARSAEGKRDQTGAIFLDCRNSSAFSDEQIMIYGNPMQDGTMFGSLASYRDQAYYEQHPQMMLFTPAQNYRIDVFAARTASPEMANYPTWFENADARSQYLNAVQAQSFIRAEVEIAADAKLVSLVTCSDYDAGENARFVVHGVLTPA